MSKRDQTAKVEYLVQACSQPSIAEIEGYLRMLNQRNAEIPEQLAALLRFYKGKVNPSSLRNSLQALKESDNKIYQFMSDCDSLA